MTFVARTWDVDPLIDQLKAARQEQGYSANEASTKLGLAIGTVAHWEAGRRMPPLYKLRQYAEMLGFQLRMTAETEVPS